MSGALGGDCTENGDAQGPVNCPVRCRICANDRPSTIFDKTFVPISVPTALHSGVKRARFGPFARANEFPYRHASSSSFLFFLPGRCRGFRVAFCVLSSPTPRIHRLSRRFPRCLLITRNDPSTNRRSLRSHVTTVSSFSFGVSLRRVSLPNCTIPSFCSFTRFNSAFRALAFIASLDLHVYVLLAEPSVGP